MPLGAHDSFCLDDEGTNHDFIHFLNFLKINHRGIVRLRSLFPYHNIEFMCHFHWAQEYALLVYKHLCIEACRVHVFLSLEHASFFFFI